MTDYELKAKVTGALAHAIAIDDAAVGVAVHGGVVTLSGRVDSWETKHAVEQLVRGVEGVRDLANEMVFELHGCPQPCDASVAEDVRAKLTAEPLLDASHILITVDDRSVMLTGRVDSPADREIAIGLAGSCRGVLDVDASELSTR